MKLLDLQVLLEVTNYLLQDTQNIVYLRVQNLFQQKHVLISFQVLSRRLISWIKFLLKARIIIFL